MGIAGQPFMRVSCVFASTSRRNITMHARCFAWHQALLLLHCQRQIIYSVIGLSHLLYDFSHIPHLLLCSIKHREQELSPEQHC